MSLLPDLITFTKYARYLEKKHRRETWDELIKRTVDMHINKYPHLKEEIERLADKYLYPKRILTSMRSLQFGGAAIERSPNRIYNCAYLPVEHYKAFSEAMFLLLGGTGLGYSVQYHHINKLTNVVGPKNSTRRFLIDDSIEGWADAVKVLVSSYFNNERKVVFDFSQIREKGMPLITSGGKAPGPEPLRKCLAQLDVVLSTAVGRKLTPIEVHSIMCYIADAVLAGGIRRAALSCLFSLEDEQMLTAKTGRWWELNPHFGRANNSVVLLRGSVSQVEFDRVFNTLRYSGSGEPGFYWTNDPDMGTNPCFEVALKPYQFCNLVEIDANKITTQASLNDAAHAASFFATLQAGYTDFHYLREEWKTTTEHEALIGVGITGIASGTLDNLNLYEAADVVVGTNRYVSDLIGINPAARTTTVKPSGTSSLVLGCSSGIHAWYAPYYLRRMRYNRMEPFVPYLEKVLPPDFLEPDKADPKNTVILSIPVKAPEGATFRDEGAINLLERVKRFNIEWIGGGHTSGANRNNVSCTINVKEHEWDGVSAWMWENRDSYNGIAILPHSGHIYEQAPFEEISKEQYEDMINRMPAFNIKQVKEYDDSTDFGQEVACAGGVCEI